ncbi:DUF6602 domain-containing protein [Rhodocyclus purpureus]|uniref:DUF6602 domain-containing protein n=1 Tax=Rhodocyclus purpureus TaxID=1067 RepID=UPI001911CFC8|nr:DUF6602 domain-containing protein [Rhodocyclus purpureus]
MGNNNSQPDFGSFHRSVTEELYSLKDRIRNLVSHWLTDGESKEVALRSVLRRHLPTSVTIGRGFIVTPTESSTQVDILIVDSNKPTLFREGDLLIVTPDAVIGVIEVKTKLIGKRPMTDTLEKLSKIEDLCRDSTGGGSVWTGLFVFEGNDSLQERLLGAVGEAYESTRCPVNCISCGKDLFVRYWARGEDINSYEKGAVWHSYVLSGVAPSYFMGNLIDSISSVDHSTAGFAWFPMLGGKEQHRKFYLPLGRTTPLQF